MYKSLLIILTLISSISVNAQIPGLKIADSLFQQKDWKAAGNIYNSILKDTSTNALELNKLGYCNCNLGRYDAALKNYRKALACKPPIFLKGLVEERIARIYGKTNKPDSALKWLNTAATSGFSNITEIDTLSERTGLFYTRVFQAFISIFTAFKY